MTHLIFQTIVITAGCYLFYRQIISPIISTYKNNKDFQKKFDLLKSEVRQNLDIFSSMSFSKTFDKENDDVVYLEYEHISHKRKIRFIQKKHQRISCMIVDKGFFPVSMDTIFKDLNIEYDLRQHGDNAYQYYTDQVRTICNLLKTEMENIEQYESSRNISYYDEILESIRTGKYTLEKIKRVIGWEDAPYFDTLTKHYCELCIKSSDTKYGEMALILNTIRPIYEYLDLLSPLTTIYCSLSEIGEDPRQYLQTYAQKEYNIHKKIFQKFANREEDKVTPASMGFKIITKPEVEIVYQYGTKMSNYDHWHIKF